MGAGTIRRDFSVFEIENLQFTQPVYESDGTTPRDLTGYTPNLDIYDTDTTHLSDAVGVTETSTGVLTGDVDISSLFPSPGAGTYQIMLYIDNGVDSPEVLFSGRIVIESAAP